MVSAPAKPAGPDCGPPPANPPMGLVSPKSPPWPPYHYPIDKYRTKVTSPAVQWFGLPTDWFHRVDAVQLGTLGHALDDVGAALNYMAIVVEEDLHSANDSNLKYAQEVLQYAQAVGCVAEYELTRLSADIRALNAKVDALPPPTPDLSDVTTKWVTDQITTAMATTQTNTTTAIQQWFAKNWAPTITGDHKWITDSDTWWNDKIKKWWANIYNNVIKPLQDSVSKGGGGWVVPLGNLTTVINTEIKPTVKLAADAGSWLKWFAHWKRDALLAFGTLKAGEVIGYLEQQYVNTHP